MGNQNIFHLIQLSNLIKTININNFNEYLWFGNLTKPSFLIISNLTASYLNIYQATSQHLLYLK